MMNRTKRSGLVSVFLCMLFLAVSALCAPALAAASPWDGYTVLAQGGSGALHAAVVEDPATEGRTLLIAVETDGVFSIVARAEHAVPASWDAKKITLRVEGNGTTPLESVVSVMAPVNDTDMYYYTKILLRDSGWFVSQARGEVAGRPYFIQRLADGTWQVSAYQLERFAVLAPEMIGQTPEDFDFEQAVRAAADAITDKYAAQAATVREMLQEAFPGTALAGGTPVDWTFKLDGERITAAAAVVHADNQAALCLWTLREDGAWNAAVNWNAVPLAADADTLYLELSYGDPDDPNLRVSLQERAADGLPELSFRLGEDGSWSLRYYSVTNAQDEFWCAEISDGVMQVYAFEFYGEIGYLYADEDPGVTAFETFDPAVFYDAMHAPYDSFMAGDPPQIPTDGSAYALPQPCGAQLKKGTYAVYSGPGKQYYREANGKAAVSANDWVQVFGTDGGWVLIQYRIDGPLLRFGYIKTSALQNPADVPALTLESTVLEDTENEFVTSNPLGLGGQIRFEYSGVTMTRLGTLGDIWMYVELTLPNGKPARMFAEIQASHG